jgi:ABC-type uncharacterized transport system permease subunit
VFLFLYYFDDVYGIGYIVICMSVFNAWLEHPELPLLLHIACMYSLKLTVLFVRLVSNPGILTRTYTYHLALIVLVMFSIVFPVQNSALMFMLRNYFYNSSAYFPEDVNTTHLIRNDNTNNSA